MDSTAGIYAKQLLESPNLVRSVGEKMNRERVYASEEYASREERILEAGEKIAGASFKSLPLETIEAAISSVEAKENEGQTQAFTFAKEQREAVEYVCSGSDLRCLVGRAGTGKTTIMKAVAEAYKGEGYRVRGAAFQGRVAEVMGEEIGITARTFASYFHQWKQYEKTKARLETGNFERGKTARYYQVVLKRQETHLLTERDVFIVDEANMVGASDWEAFLSHAAEAGARVITLGDSAQKLSLEEGDTFRLLGERYGTTELKTIRRQKVEWQRTASNFLNDHNIEDSLRLYAQQDRIQWQESLEETIHQLCWDYVEGKTAHPDRTRMALAFTNEDVNRINRKIFEIYKKEGDFKDTFKINGNDYALGCRLVFLENDNHGKRVPVVAVDDAKRELLNKKGVKNGTLGTLVHWNEEKSLLKVRLDDGRFVGFDPKDYKKFQLGYAMTGMKSEGSTFDEAHVLASSHCKASDALVMLTRHRYDCNLYAPRETFTDFKGLVQSLSKVSHKSVLQDFVIDEENRPFAEKVQSYLDMANDLSDLNNKVDSRVSDEEKATHFENLSKLYDHQKDLANEIVEDWENTGVYARQVGLSKETLEVRAGLRERLLSDAEEQTKRIVGDYVQVARKARGLWNEITETHGPGLAPTHPLYQDYLSLKEERGSLAVAVVEREALSRQFFVMKPSEEAGKLVDVWGDVHEETSLVGFSSAKRHAESYLKEKSIEAWEKTLPEEERADVALLKSYKESRNLSAALYHEYKAFKEADILDTAKVEEFQLKCSEESKKRDGLAYKIISRAEHFEGYYGPVGLDEKAMDRLVDHSLNGEFREKVSLYESERDVVAKGVRAGEVLSHLQPGVQQPVLHAILKESGLAKTRVNFDVAFGNAFMEGQVSENAISSDIYVELEAYKAAKKEAGDTWRGVQAGLVEKLDTVVQEQLELLKVVDPETPDYEVLKEEYEEKIQKKAANDKFAIYGAQVVGERVPFLDMTARLKPEYEDIEDNMEKLESLQEQLATKDSFVLLQESLQESLWRDQKRDRERLADRVMSNNVLMNFVKHHESKLESSIIRDKTAYDLDTIISVYESSNSVYAKCMAASYLEEQSSKEQKTGKRKVIAALQTRCISFEGINCHAALWEGLEKGEVDLESLSHISADIDEYVEKKSDYSSSWGALGFKPEKKEEGAKEEDEEESEEKKAARKEANKKLGIFEKEEDIKEAIEEAHSDIRKVFKSSIKSLQIEKSENTKEVTGISIESEAKRVANRIVRTYEQARMRRDQSIRHVERNMAPKNESASDKVLGKQSASIDKATLLAAEKKLAKGEEVSFEVGTALQKKYEEAFEKKVDEGIETQLVFYGQQGEENKDLIRRNLKRIHFAKDDLFRGKVRATEGDERFKKMREVRNEAAYKLMSYDFIKSHVEASNVFQVKRIKDFATYHGWALERKEAEEKAEKRGKTASSKSFSRKPSRRYVSAEQVLAAAAGNYESLVADLIGGDKPRRRGNEVRFGRKGSLRIYVSGPREGSWSDFSSREGGNIFSLVQREMGGDFKDAVAYLAGKLGVTPEMDFKFTPKTKAQKNEEREQEREERRQKLNSVQRLQSQSQDIKGTPAETYLRKTRHIRCEFAEDLRFIPQGTKVSYLNKSMTLYNPTLASFGRNERGDLLSVQLISLTDKGEKAKNKAGETYSKLKYGVGVGSFVTLQNDSASSTVFIAEGIETALSIKEAGVKGKIVAAQGISNIQNYKGAEKHIVLVADNDTHNPSSGTPETLKKAKAYFEEKGLKVSQIIPPKPGDDFNDVLKESGVEKVREIVDGQLDLKATEAAIQTDSLKEKQAQFEESQKMIAHMVSKNMPAHAIETFKKSFEWAPEATIEHFKKNYKDYGREGEGASPEKRYLQQVVEEATQSETSPQKVNRMIATLENLNFRIDYLKEKMTSESLIRTSEHQRETLYREFIADPTKMETLKTTAPEMYEQVAEFQKTQKGSDKQVAQTSSSGDQNEDVFKQIESHFETIRLSRDSNLKEEAKGALAKLLGAYAEDKSFLREAKLYSAQLRQDLKDYFRENHLERSKSKGYSR